MNYKTHVLSNGLKLVTAPVAGTRTATILIMVATGSKFEDRRNNGVSHFLEHMFFKGTKKRPSAQAIANAFDSIGSENNAFTTKEYTGFWVKVGIKNLETAAEILSDMIKNSKLDAVEIEREKGVIIEELNMYVDNPIMHIDDVFERCLYDGTPAGQEIIGTKKSITGLRREDFVDYIGSQYGAENMILTVAGNINEEKIRRLMEKYFSQVKKSRAIKKLPVVEAQKKPALTLNYKKTDQAHLMLGVRSFPAGAKTETSEQLLSAILGGSMSSRLFIELRERRGLAYYVRAQSEGYSDTGYLAAQAGLHVEKVEESIKIIIDEFKKIARQDLKPAELKRIKDLVKGRLAIHFESSDAIASWYARQAALALEKAKAEKDTPGWGDLKKEIISPAEYFSRVDRVRAGEIRELAAMIFKNRGLNLAIIGPYRDEKRFTKLLNF